MSAKVGLDLDPAGQPDTPGVGSGSTAEACSQRAATWIHVHQLALQGGRQHCPNSALPHLQSYSHGHMTRLTGSCWAVMIRAD